MREQKFITAEQETAARREHPRIQPYRAPVDPRAGWAKDYLRQQFRNEFGGDHPPDWRVYTGFVPALQEAAERAVAAGVQRIAGRGEPPLESALVAIDPHTGHILAMVGGSNYRTSTFNRATRSRRQAGSAFKPFVYAAALSNGFTPVTVLSNLDRVTAPRDPEWRPTNVTYRDSPDPTRVSAARRARRVEQRGGRPAAAGGRKRQGAARRVGCRSEGSARCAVAGAGGRAGDAGRLTAAYTMFPGGGEVVAPRGITNVLDANGIERVRAIARTEAGGERSGGVSDAEHAPRCDRQRHRPWRTRRGRDGPGRRQDGNDRRLSRRVVRGLLLIGCGGVWVGFDQPKPIAANAYGARMALPIWADFMKRAAPLLPAREFAVPSTVEGEPLCSVSHLRPVEGCPVYTEYFKEGDDKPSQLCPLHRGSLKQVVVRTADRLLRGIGRAVAGIFRR